MVTEERVLYYAIIHHFFKKSKRIGEKKTPKSQHFFMHLMNKLFFSGHGERKLPFFTTLKRSRPARPQSCIASVRRTRSIRLGSFPTFNNIYAKRPVKAHRHRPADPFVPSISQRRSSGRSRSRLLYTIFPPLSSARAQHRQNAESARRLHPPIHSRRPPHFNIAFSFLFYVVIKR